MFQLKKEVMESCLESYELKWITILMYRLVLSANVIVNAVVCEIAWNRPHNCAAGEYSKNMGTSIFVIIFGVIFCIQN